MLFNFEIFLFKKAKRTLEKNKKQGRPWSFVFQEMLDLSDLVSSHVKGHPEQSYLICKLPHSAIYFVTIARLWWILKVLILNAFLFVEKIQFVETSVSENAYF